VHALSEELTRTQAARRLPLNSAVLGNLVFFGFVGTRVYENRIAEAGCGAERDEENAEQSNRKTHLETSTGSGLQMR
jgi:hypothetical protein